MEIFNDQKGDSNYCIIQKKGKLGEGGGDKTLKPENQEKEHQLYYTLQK